MQWQIILKKELREMFRDKRVRSAMFFGPAFSVILTMMMFGLIFTSIKKATKTTIHVINQTDDTATKAFVQGLEKGGIKVVKLSSVKEAEEKIKKGDVRLAIDFGKGMAETLAKPAPFTLNAYFDPGEQKAQISLAVIEKIASVTNETVVKSIFREKAVDEAFVTPIKVKRNEVKVGETTGNEFLVQLLPYLIVIWAFYGAFSSASDIVSGEKERQTLETLLISPVARSQVAIGKLLALATCSVAAISVSLGSILLMYIMKIEMLKPLFEQGLGLTVTGFFVVVSALIPTSILFASALLAVSAYARNTREAQTYLAQASIVVMLPAVFSQIIGYTDLANSRAVYAIPILNSTNVIRNALLGRYDAIGIFMTIGIGIALAAIAMAICIRQFKKESILNRI